MEGREDTLTEEEARKILENSMRVLFYRDARSLNKVGFHIFFLQQMAYGSQNNSFIQFQIATITAEGVNISDSISTETVWDFAEGIRGYGAQTQ